MQINRLLLSIQKCINYTMIRRNTEQQRVIRQTIEDAGRPLLIKEIHEMSVCQSSGIGLRTVYRSIKRLLEDQLITRVKLTGQLDRYELATPSDSHHHHFHCNSCDRVFDVKGCPGRLDKMLPNGFLLEDHEITLKGLCKACA